MSAVARGDAQALLILDRILFRNGTGNLRLGFKQCCPRARLWQRRHLRTVCLRALWFAT